ncbi:MAG: hypothetical protein IPF92_27305 [Myxococcales bacterium]|nr:hypothetical protein [Myxococcales bacterium]MBL0194043.1 hypothetical protein [Myxococcales bacterium]HQY64377.1 hypothetical protein [Polyangiaceae bacterium]
MLPFANLPPLDTTSLVAAQVRVEGRGRFTAETTSAAVTPQTRPVLESELAPQLRYDLLWRHGFSHFVAIYAPRFIIPDTTNIDTLRFSAPTQQERDDSQANNTPLPPQFGAFHNFALGLEIDQKRTHWGLYGFGGYGPISNTALLVQKPWSGEGMPASPYPIIPTLGAASFNLLFLQAQGFVNIRLTRRVTLTPQASFGAFGGAESLSRRTIPLTYGPAYRLTLDLKSTPLDTWKTSLGGGYQLPALFNDDRVGSPTVLFEAEERLVHQWRPLITSEIAAGARTAQNPTFGARMYPTVEANTVFGWDHRASETRLATIAKVGPWINLLSGDVEQKVESIVAINHRIDRTTLRGQASVGVIAGNTDVISKYVLATAQSSVAYQFTRIFSADVGVRTTTQLFSNAQRRFDTQQLMFFGGLTVHTDPSLRL